MSEKTAEQLARESTRLKAKRRTILATWPPGSERDDEVEAINRRLNEIADARPEP